MQVPATSSSVALKMVPAVFSPLWLKFASVAGMAVFVSVSIFFIWSGWLRPGWPAQLLSVGTGLLLLWFTFSGAQIARFLGHSLSIGGGWVTIRSRWGEQVYSLSEVHFRVREGLRTIEVRDAAGRQVYAADFRATNADALRAFVESVERQERILRNRDKPRITRAQFVARRAESARHANRESKAFWALVIGLAIIWLAITTGRAGTYKSIFMLFVAAIAILAIYVVGSAIRSMWVGGTTATRFGLVCGSCEGGLVGWGGDWAISTGRCPHCGLPPFKA
jgi:hypothetical protein